MNEYDTEMRHKFLGKWHKNEWKLHIMSNIGWRKGDSSVEYHPEFQGIVPGSKTHPNNMLGHYFWVI